jgi:hypothetical protein
MYTGGSICPAADISKPMREAMSAAASRANIACAIFRASASGSICSAVQPDFDLSQRRFRSGT